VSKTKFDIADLFELRGAVIYNPDDYKATARVTIDSRAVKKGAIFLAIKGKRFDGHSFVRDAVKNGAGAVVISKRKLGEFDDVDIPIVAVPNTIKAFGELAAIKREKLNYKIVGITGSNGKTTTKEFAATLLAEKFKTGKTDVAKKAAFSHTGNIAGNYEMFMTLSQNAGSIIKNSIESLIFSPQYLEEENVIIVTNAGGPGTILSDLVEQNGKKIKSLNKETIEKLNTFLPPTWSHNNPIDIIGDATDERYKKTIEAVKDLSKLIYVIITPQYMTNATSIVKSLKKYKNTIPVLLGDKSFKKAKEFLDKEKKLYFTSLEEASKIL
jgi:hypothetical protein